MYLPSVFIAKCNTEDSLFSVLITNTGNKIIRSFIDNSLLHTQLHTGTH